MNAQTRYVFPSLGKIYERYGDAGWPLFRIVYGLFYIPHGCQKLFGWYGGNVNAVAKAIETIGLSPGIAWAYFIGGLELIGGVLLVLGLCTRLVALLFAGFMFVAAFFFHAQFGYFWTAGGIEMPLLLMWMAAALALRGGGEFSLDRSLGREL
jgi:putative oxidoreductase